MVVGIPIRTEVNLLVVASFLAFIYDCGLG